MHTIVHFEIPANDTDRAIEFYSGLFGWKIQKTPGSTDYWMIETVNEKGETGLAGGLMSRQHPQQQITNYVAVASVDEYSKKVSKLGGTIIMPRTAVPGFGYYAICLDTESNSFAIWEHDSGAA